MHIHIFIERVLFTYKHFSDAPPYKLNLILDGHALAFQGDCQGIYLLEEGSKINGYEHWYQPDGSNDVWFGQSYTGWHVAGIAWLGQDYAGIVGPDGQDEVKWPTQISVGYRFYGNSSWIPAASHEVVFIECKYL